MDHAESNGVPSAEPEAGKPVGQQGQDQHLSADDRDRVQGGIQESVQDGSVGRTVMREVRLTAGAPSDLAVEWVGDVRQIAPVPMIGGRSPDGRFLATGTNYGYLLELP